MKIFLKLETEDKKSIFYTDKDISTQDFYWRYDRGLENVDTTKEYTIKGEAAENLNEKERENSKFNRLSNRFL